MSLFAIVYNVPRYFESTIVWNATENTGYFIRTSLGSSTLYTRLGLLRHTPHWPIYGQNYSLLYVDTVYPVTPRFVYTETRYPLR